MRINHKRLGEVLMDAGAITEIQLQEGLEKSKERGTLLGETLIDIGYIDEKTLYQALEFLFHVPYIDLTETPIDKKASSLIPEKLAKKYTLIPIKVEDNVLTVVMNDPLNFYAVDDVKRATGLRVEVGISPIKEINNAIERYYGSENAQKAFEDLKKEYGDLDLLDLSSISANEVAEAPVVRLINSILQHAINSNASDIHIEPTAKEVRVRFRIDGKLQDVMNSAISAHSAIVTRIKIMGEMDIAEKRIPQDGRVETSLDDRTVDLRISILPTIYGEKVVIRILGGSAGALDRKFLGLSEENELLFDKITKSPNGIVLVSGPTGSGKTTTLYTLLKELNKPEVNVITVEDPVEYKLDGISQVQVNNKAGLTFASGLRSILRQDPDIIMIGEIRDAETAQIAIRASITGHIVLSTIHTNDAASSVIRLIDMGIESYLVSSSVVGVVAQRLVRKICPKCKTAYRPSHSEMMLLKMKEPTSIYKGEGCPACNFTGYKGRIGIHEVLVLTKEIRELINRGASTDQLQQMAIRQGTITLRQSCAELVLKGVTTVEEMIKVTYSVEG
ncbi:Flp pilus assembly complex ATPase component TadA [Clostridia bacterium]|nr:Flp pilus assembly complex ATPase component TadA [Clostridia bacterium]